MKQLIFIRHGESLSNIGAENAIMLSNAEIPLTKHGHNLAKELANNWPIAPRAIYTSEFIRTEQTALPLCQKYKIKPIALSTLNECDTIGFDIAKNLSSEEKISLIKHYWQRSDPNERIGKLGETYTEFCQRVHHFKMQTAELDNHSIIIGHGMWLAQFIWQILKFGGQEPSSQNMHQFGNFFMSLPIPNLSQFEITLIDDHLSICQK